MLMLSVEKELTFPMPSGSEEAPVVVDAIQSRGHLTPRLSVRCWEPHDHDGRNHLGKSVPMRDPAALRGVCTREIQLIDQQAVLRVYLHQLSLCCWTLDLVLAAAY